MSIVYHHYQKSPVCSSNIAFASFFISCGRLYVEGWKSYSLGNDFFIIAKFLPRRSFRLIWWSFGNWVNRTPEIIKTSKGLHFQVQYYFIALSKVSYQFCLPGCISRKHFASLALCSNGGLIIIDCRLIRFYFWKYFAYKTLKFVIRYSP